MKRFLPLFLCSFIVVATFAKSVTPAESLPAYYADIDGKSGKTLFDAIHVVSKVGYSSLGYDGLWSAYRYTDLRDNGKVWDMYSDCNWTLGSDQCGTYSSECDCYNREHSIPKSWYGGKTSGPGCDIFHLVPTDGKVNGMRSNYAFGEVSSADYSYDGAKKGSAKSITIVDGNTIAGNEGTTISASGTVFEPRDEYKGDFARGYFGAMIRWANGDHQSFTTGEGSKIFSSSYSTGAFGLTKYGVALLMKWHRQDPVSQKEIDRNNGIQQTQGNRNPFIDYPYLAEYIWGEKAGESVDLSQLITAYDERFVLGESDGYLGSNAGTNNNCTITWMVNNSPYTAGNPTTTVKKGGVVTTLPTAPASCDEISSQFVGWSEYIINGTTDRVPSDLFSDANDAPDILGDITFHAVFAQLTEEEVAYAPAATNATTYQMDLNNTDGWTISGLQKQSKYWKMISDSYIESPSLDASQITSITINMRTWGGASYNTIEFALGNQKVGQLVASNNSLNDYTWTPSTTVSGTGALHFSSPTCTADNGPALSKIVIELSGNGTGDNGGGNDDGGDVVYTYSRYITSCGSTDVEDIISPNQPSAGKKILLNGQLLIEYNGVYYNTLGQELR